MKLETYCTYEIAHDAIERQRKENIGINFFVEYGCFIFSQKNLSMKKSQSFFEFLDSRIDYLTECNRLGTAQNYKCVRRSLEKYLGVTTLSFSEITPGFVDGYSDWLAKRGLKKNSVSFHMRILRAVFNKGVRKGMVKQNFPFSEVYTGIDKTVKRCLPEDVVSKLKALDLRNNSYIQTARDMFLFSLYTRGMAFVDMAYLKKENIQGKVIFYRRKKSNSIMKVKIEKEISEIISCYESKSKNSPYIFPILKDTTESVNHSLYLRALGLYNYRLRLLAEMIGYKGSLSSYTARHTWASMVYKLEVPLSVISAGLGHTTEKVTRIYLESLDSSKVDKANRKLINAIGAL